MYKENVGIYIGVFFSHKEKWMELEFIMLMLKATFKKASIVCFCSYVESRPKMIIITTTVIIIIMRHECKRGISGGNQYRGI
jgi:hypothetical protein